jgi:uncharacterized protein (TIGR02246 family)
MTIDSAATSDVSPSEADRAAVGSVPGLIIRAWTNHDAKAFAEVFTEQGTMIMPGVFRKGRNEIEKFMAAGFAGPYRGSQVIGEPIDLRFHGNEDAVVVTRGGVLRAGQAELTPGQTVHATWVVIKKDGRWQLAAYQNSPVK